jgi:zinc transport system substrate-binding protein
MQNRTAIASLFLAGCTMCACHSREAAKKSHTPERSEAEDTLTVAAAVEPVAWLGCQMAGPPCRTIVLVPPGASAHTWEPRPADLEALQGASVYLRTGLAFEEAWTPRLQSTIPGLRVLDLRGGLSMVDRDEPHVHHSEEADPHVWSSPRAFLELADTLAPRWEAASPELAKRIRAHLPAVRTKLLSLDSLARERLGPFSGRTFVVNHPGLGYLARDYGLVQMPLESFGQELTPVILFEIRRTAHAQGIRAIFVQPEASRRVADQIALDLGVPTVDLDLLARGPYDSIFRAVLDRLAGGL